MAFSGLPIVIPNPISLGQLVTQGALVAALLLALSNLYGVVRPKTILVRLTVGDASPYLLELVLAAAVLAAPIAGGPAAPAGQLGYSSGSRPRW